VRRCGACSCSSCSCSQTCDMPQRGWSAQLPGLRRVAGKSTLNVVARARSPYLRHTVDIEENEVTVRKALGDLNSIVCFKAVVVGIEDTIGIQAAGVALKGAGRKRGKQLADSVSGASRLASSKQRAHLTQRSAPRGRSWQASRRSRGRMGATGYTSATPCARPASSWGQRASSRLPWAPSKVRSRYWSARSSAPSKSAPYCVARTSISWSVRNSEDAPTAASPSR
jgi:hypothetical protein